MANALLAVALQLEQDVVVARQRARQIAALLGFDPQDQTRIATAVSEIARNAYRYARGGRVEFSLEGSSAPQVLIINVRDEGPGIANLEQVLSGHYRSETGMGVGIIGTHRLMDKVEIRTRAGAGTDVELKKILPARAPLIHSRDLGPLTAELAGKPPVGAYEELQQQNRELLRTLAELRERQEDLIRLNRELEDTNRGVVALYAELDEKADHLRRADEMKSKFLCNMSHEFRTPLNSMRALSRLLLERVDGDLNEEQEKQVSLIAQSTADLTSLVDDLLDLAKIEAGKVEVRPVEFSVANLFSALRGMLRPLLAGESVRLTFDEPAPTLMMVTDEGKVAQILRNFISNAIKFTEQGEVRVSAQPCGEAGLIRFAISDTGVGIRPEHQALIFEEFTQVPNPLQGRVKGTGLGLPLCRKLAQLLGGEVQVQSKPGAGSTFTVTLPVQHEEIRGKRQTRLEPLQPGLSPVLFIEADAETSVVHEKYLRGSSYQCVCARTLREARELMQHVRPHAVVLDILLKGEDAWAYLNELKTTAATAHIPVLVLTSVDDERKGLALGADSYCMKPLDQRTLLEKLDSLTGRRVLIIDDDPASRYLMRKLLSEQRASVLEASDGRSGLLAARRSRPSLILLDLRLPDIGGESILEALKSDDTLRKIPVAIVTSGLLSQQERARLQRRAQAVVPKNELDAGRTRALLAATEGPL